MRRGACGLVAAILAVAAVPTGAVAEPTIWRKTRSPQLFREAEAIDQSERSLPVGVEITAFDLKRALGFLDAAGARHSSNPTLLYIVGHLLERLGKFDSAQYEIAEPFFRAVVASDVNGVVKSGASESLAQLAVRRGDYRAGISSYADALVESPSEPTRGLLLANQAEAYMVLGDTSHAIEGYRAAISAMPSYCKVAATTFFSLGVALDRSGDLDGGLEAIAIAHNYDPDDTQLKSDRWAFVPPYDADWYWGLESLLSARKSGDPDVRAKSYAEALDHFATYVRNAPEKDPYVSIARGHESSIRREAAKAGSGKAEPMQGDRPP